MREFSEITQDNRWIGADFVLFAELFEGAADVPLHERLEQIDHAHAIGQSQHLAHVFRANRSSGVRDRLIEQRKRVAHRAFSRARNQRKRCRLDLDLFFRRDTRKMLDESAGIDAPQIKALAA
jgi:hypothetical protein